MVFLGGFSWKGKAWDYVVHGSLGSDLNYIVSLWQSGSGEWWCIGIGQLWEKISNVHSLTSSKATPSWRWRRPLFRLMSYIARSKLFTLYYSDTVSCPEERMFCVVGIPIEPYFVCVTIDCYTVCPPEGVHLGHRPNRTGPWFGMR